MKQLKFASSYVPLILAGTKTATWRMKDDKDLTTGDEVEFVDRDSGNVFCRALLTSVKETSIAAFTDEDREGNLEAGSKQEMLAWFQQTYGNDVTMDTPLKLIRFQVEHPVDSTHLSS